MPPSEHAARWTGSSFLNSSTWPMRLSWSACTSVPIARKALTGLEAGGWDGEGQGGGGGRGGRPTRDGV
eukprot:scaffold271749_cov33-Tisochrysis_lutea.AAC.1